MESRNSLLEHPQEPQALGCLGGDLCVWIRFVFVLNLELSVQSRFQPFGCDLLPYFRKSLADHILGKPVLALYRDENGPTTICQCPKVFALHFWGDLVSGPFALSPVLGGTGRPAVARLASGELSIVSFCDRFSGERVTADYFTEVAPGVFAELVGSEAPDLFELVLGGSV